MSLIDEYLSSSIKTLRKMKTAHVELAAEKCLECIENGGKIIFCGNGGSAADSQHLAAELVGRFRLERRPLPAVALTANTAIITAVANDYDYSRIFSRQLRALGNPGDVLVAISTSGGSPNVIEAMRVAGEMSIITIGLTGSPGGEVAASADISIKAPVQETSYVQEALLAAGHALCHYIEVNAASGDAV